MRTMHMALKNLMARPSRTTLTMFWVFIGATVIITISIANEGAIGALDTLHGVVAGTSDLVVMSSTDDEEGFPEEARRRVVTVDGVQVAAPSVHAVAALVGADAPSTVASGGGLPLSGSVTLGDGCPGEVAAVTGALLTGRLGPHPSMAS